MKVCYTRNKHFQTRHLRHALLREPMLVDHELLQSDNAACASGELLPACMLQHGASELLTSSRRMTASYVSGSPRAKPWYNSPLMYSMSSSRRSCREAIHSINLFLSVLANEGSGRITNLLYTYLLELELR